MTEAFSWRPDVSHHQLSREKVVDGKAGRTSVLCVCGCMCVHRNTLPLCGPEFGQQPLLCARERGTGEKGISECRFRVVQLAGPRLMLVDRAPPPGLCLSPSRTLGRDPSQAFASLAAHPSPRRAPSALSLGALPAFLSSVSVRKQRAALLLLVYRVPPPPASPRFTHHHLFCVEFC